MNTKANITQLTDTFRMKFGQFIIENDELINSLWEIYVKLQHDVVGIDTSINRVQFIDMMLNKGEVMGFDDPRVKVLNTPTNGSKDRKTTFGTHAEVEGAVLVGLITARQGAAYKANITMSQKVAS